MTVVGLITVVVVDNDVVTVDSVVGVDFNDAAVCRIDRSVTVISVLNIDCTVAVVTAPVTGDIRVVDRPLEGSGSDARYLHGSDFNHFVDRLERIDRRCKGTADKHTVDPPLCIEGVLRSVDTGLYFLDDAFAQFTVGAVNRLGDNRFLLHGLLGYNDINRGCEVGNAQFHAFTQNLIGTGDLVTVDVHDLRCGKVVVFRTDTGYGVIPPDGIVFPLRIVSVFQIVQHIRLCGTDGFRRCEALLHRNGLKDRNADGTGAVGLQLRRTVTAVEDGKFIRRDEVGHILRHRLIEQFFIGNIEFRIDSVFIGKFHAGALQCEQAVFLQIIKDLLVNVFIGHVALFGDEIYIRAESDFRTGILFCIEFLVDGTQKSVEFPAAA